MRLSAVFHSFGFLMLLGLSGCAGITAVNIPSIGYFDFDPAPLAPEDRTLMYLALADAASREQVGATASWTNENTGRWGSYTVTSVFPHALMPEPGCFGTSGYVPGAEVTEEIYSDDREFLTSGMGIYWGIDGRWYRYK